MGVKGLWTLIEPVGRPIRPETLEGQRLAIDSSIWLYHFQMAMRDKSGRTLKNAHILGFLWRILKLLHLGIKPVFVFDGVAPVLKRKTLSNRKARKTGAQESHARTASKLLNAQLREAALRHVAEKQSEAAKKSKARADDEWESDDEGQADALREDLGDGVVYMDDLMGLDKEAAPSKGEDPPRPPSPVQQVEDSPEKGKTKKKDYHKDPYALPPLEGSLSTIGLNPGRSRSSRSASATGPSAANEKAKALGTKVRAPAARAKKDVRYATEAELRSMMANLKPEDLSAESEFFANLPVALQYELVGDMRAQSRGTSYKRLMAMQAAAPTAADFSKQQVMGLKTRNDWTQRVLEVTDQIGSAHIKVDHSTDKGRIVGSRGKEYILVRNEKDGGFVLGLRKGEGASEAKAIDVEKLDAGEQDADLILSDEDDEVRWEKSRKGTARNGANHQKGDHVRSFGDSSDEGDFQEVDVDAQPSDVPEEVRQLMDDEGDVFARKEKAMALLKQKAKDHAKRHRQEAGIRNIEDVLEDEELDELARGHNPRGRPKRGKSDLFRADEVGPDEVVEIDAEAGSEVATELSDESENLRLTEIMAKDTSHLALPNSKPADEESLEDFGADVYDTMHFGDENSDDGFQEVELSQKRLDDDTFEEVELPTSSTKKEMPAPPRIENYKLSNKRKGTPSDEEEESGGTHAGIPALGFRYEDRAGMPVALNKNLFLRDDKRQQDFQSNARSDQLKDEKDAAISKQRTKSSTFSATPEVKAVPPHDSGKLKLDDDQAGTRSHSEDRKASQVKLLNTPMESEMSKAESLKDAASEKPGAFSSQQGDRGATPRSVGSERSNHIDGSPAEETMPSPSLTKTAIPNPLQVHTLDDPQKVQQDQNSSDEDDASSRSNSPESVVLGADGFPLPTIEELDQADEDDEDLDALLQRETQGLTALLRDQQSTQNPKGAPVKKTIREMQQEAEAEVSALREQVAASRRTEEDVTKQMALDVQYMLRQFGVPYITGPREAEAQCAELVRLGLCDGVITDDSDVFLFGADRVFKNMFNDNKTVQCFVSSDLLRTVGLDRRKLIRLAYLLGSDYTDGLDGVGVVLAMEILSVFPGDDGLRDFRNWWIQVQQGADKEYFPPGEWDEEEKKQIKKRLTRIKKTLVKKVHLSGDWPDPLVQDAYLEAEVDSSDEPFAWGLPDLEQVRKCLFHFLGWSIEKVDQYVCPVMDSMMRRGRAGGQSRLDNGFFDNSAGKGAFAPRERVKFGSTRLQQVINGFRAAQQEARQQSAQLNEASSEEDVPVAKTTAKRKRASTKRKGKQGNRKAKENKEANAENQEGESSGTDSNSSDGSYRQGKKPARKAARGARRKRAPPTKFSSKKGSGPANLQLARNMSFDDLSALPQGRTAQISPSP